MVFAEFIARADGAPAVAAYRQAFQPSTYRAEPFAGVATIALAADTAEEADRLAALAPRPPERPGAPPESEGFIRRFRGDGPAVRAYLTEKAAHTGADELFVLNGGPTLESRLRSMELIAELIAEPASAQPSRKPLPPSSPGVARRPGTLREPWPAPAHATRRSSSGSAA